MRFRILVAEPVSVARDRLLSVLREVGTEVEAVDNLYAACMQLVARQYDLVCADLGLSQEDGLDLADLLERQPGAVPLVVTADEDTVHARSQARDLDALGFLPRPYAEPQLRSLIRQAMARHRPHAPSGEPPRILMYSHDTIGLGHMRRNANIAREVLRLRPDASVLMLIGCPAGLVFELPAGVDFVKLPSLVKLSRHEWRSDRLNISADRARELRARLIRESIGAFEPDLILVDHVPTGVWSELSEVLAELRCRPHSPDIVLGLRDILDAPAATRRNWEKTGADRAIADLYDEVLVYGEPRVFDTVRTYGLDMLAPGRATYAGYVAARADPLDVAAARARLSPDGRPLALISGGGGRDAFPVISAALDGLAAMPEHRRPATTVVSGPLMAPELRARLRERSGALGIRCFDRMANFPACLAASDFLLGMAGYNSTVEAAAVGVPTLVVPRRGPSAEQLTRARVFAARGLADTLLPDMATPEMLGERLARVEPDAQPVPRLLANGATCAATRLIDRLEARTGGAPLAKVVS